MTGQRRLMDALMGYARDFRGVDPETGEADYWKRGGLAGLLGMPSALEQSPQDIAMGFAGSVTPKVGGLLSAGAKPIRAYHGSPHDFDKFDLSKIGTGEGAQAYGHGLYFAENEGVARSYKAAGQPSYLDAQRIQTAQDLLRESGGDRLKAIALADERMRGTKKYSEGKLYQDVVNNFDYLVGKTPGRMYEVDIHADPSRFLDWDKPLSAQPEARAAFDKIAPQIAAEDIPGQLAYYRLGDKRLQSPEASASLREAGIPGIKYLDQGSRGSGTGTSNYVVFDDKLIEILKKYGIAGLTGGGAMGFGSMGGAADY